MKTRIFLGATMIVAIVAVFQLDYQFAVSARQELLGLPVTVLVAALAAAGFFEVARLAGGAHGGVLPVTGLISAVAMATMPYWRRLIAPLAGGEGALAAIGLMLIAVFAEQMVRFRTDGAMRRIGATLAAVLYIGVGGAVMLAIRMEMGIDRLVLFLAAVKCTDIGAYFVGSAIGRHKLVPWLSPGKSWEGLAGGLAAGAVASLVVSLAAGGCGMSAAQAALFGAVIGLAGQFADLCESLLKRSANVKDSGAVVPEFGGVLDILDSPLLSAPLAYLLLKHFACG